MTFGEVLTDDVSFRAFSVHTFSSIYMYIWKSG
jgi:hypothetical protein